MAPQDAQLSPAIAALLGRLRRRIRLYVLAEGLTAVLIVAGLAFWIGLLLDWMLEPSPAIRVFAIGAVVAILGMVAWRMILARAFARLADSSMALLLEKYSPGFHDSLLTVVELSAAPAHAREFSPEMLRHTTAEAVENTDKVQLGSVFNPRPLWRNAVAAGVLVGSIVLFGVFASGAFGFYLNRIQLSETPWPRRVHLVVDGFPADAAGQRVTKVARGGTLDLNVTAANQQPYEIPDRVEIRYVLGDGRRGRADMTRQGEAALEAVQPYAYKFKDLFESQTFDVLGGDDRVRGLRIEVVDSPEITGMTLHCQYPAYMRRSPRDLAVSGNMQIPVGTKITLTAETNKPLERAKLIDAEHTEPVIITPSTDKLDQFRHDLGEIKADRILLFVLRDLDGIETREPIRLSIAAVADEATQITASLKGIGTAVTPSANIPLVGKISDDYGVGRVWFEHRINDGDPAQTPFAPAAKGENELPIEQSLDVRPLGLAPDQKLLLAVKASDQYDLSKDPNEGSSQRFLLDVVTPEKLRSLLEGRELMLRRRFETIYAEMLDTRDLMVRIDFAPAEAKPAAAPKDDAKPDASKANDAKTEEAAKPAGESLAAPATNDKSATGDATPQERELSRRKLRIVRSLQNVQRSGHETLAVATAFEEIREELINNRIDTEELKQRLQVGIADPLKQIGGPLVGELSKRLESLEAKAADVETGPAQLRLAVEQADLVLVEMKQVLDRMLELESYNEVLEKLRAIIDTQQKINERTKKQSKKILED